jgi:hypothetical protein
MASPVARIIGTYPAVNRIKRRYALRLAVSLSPCARHSKTDITIAILGRYMIVAQPMDAQAIFIQLGAVARILRDNAAKNGVTSVMSRTAIMEISAANSGGISAAPLTIPAKIVSSYAPMVGTSCVILYRHSSHAPQKIPQKRAIMGFISCAS